jgi:pyruvate ferredoxin oxidoreductase delta subunit
VGKPEIQYTWKDIEVGAIVTEAGSASQYKTGDWRSQRPTYNLTQCIKCATCQIFCPEGCINEDAEGHYVADLYYCKGCGVCARECPTKVITMVLEEE